MLGDRHASEVLIPQLFVTDSPEEIPFGDLPEEYIVKANHGCGMNLIVKGGEPEPEVVVKQSKKWLEQRYGASRNEWAYEPIDRKIVIEQLLRNQHGNLPDDYKFYMFHGECGHVFVMADRYHPDR